MPEDCVLFPAVPSPQSRVSLKTPIVAFAVVPPPATSPRVKVSFTSVIVAPAGMPLSPNPINARAVEPLPFVPAKRPAPPPLLLLVCAA